MGTGRQRQPEGSQRVTAGPSGGSSAHVNAQGRQQRAEVRERRKGIKWVKRTTRVGVYPVPPKGLEVKQAPPEDRPAENQSAAG